MKKLILFVLTISFISWSSNNFHHTTWAQQEPRSPTVSSDPTSRPSPSSEIRTIQTTEIKGEVLRSDGNTLTLQTENGTKEVSLPQNVTVKRNTMEARIGDIKPGDDVTVMQSQNGEVLSIAATAGEVFDWGKWLVPLTIVGLILVGLIWWLMKRANKPHIKTTVE